MVDIVAVSRTESCQNGPVVPTVVHSFVIGTPSCATIEIVSMGDIPQVPVTDLPNDFTDDPARVVLDVREDDEWAHGHIRGALHIPLAEVPARLDELDLDRELLVICHSSGRSMRVLAYLSQVGYDGSCVRGGMLAWIENGKPVETGAS